jgi:hypothetical protein
MKPSQLRFKVCDSHALRQALALLLIALAMILGAIAQAPAPVPAQARAEHFMVVDVLVETGPQPLAAYQIEITATNLDGAVKIVGIEGGEMAAFRNPPYYDPTAMQGDRVIVGAFSTAPAEQLPQGSVKIAAVHCLVPGDSTPVFRAKPAAAAAHDGQPISIQVNVKERKEK